jgi:bifunctional non-homologous end joining protein LigD
LYRKLKLLVRRKSAFSEPPPEKNITFLAPRLVAQISYQELTADRKLRQPVFLGLRDDKEAQEVRMPTAAVI